MVKVAEAYDVVVVGGGHNGLVAATYIARGGRRVLVLERGAKLGGVAGEDVQEGFHFPTGPTLCGLLRPEVVEQLELERHGFQTLPFDPAVTALGEEGKTLHLWRDMEKSRGEIAVFSKADAEAYPTFEAVLCQIAQVLDPLMVRTPPSVVDTSKGDLLYLMRRAYRLRKMGKEAMHQAVRLPPMALANFLNEWFEDGLLKGTLALDGLQGSFRGPYSPGTAFAMVSHHLPEAWGGSWAFVKGGMGTLMGALASAAREAGVAIRTGAEVKRITVQEGRATGVELSTGEGISARVVVSNADPKATLLGLVDPEELEPNFILKLRNFRTEGCVSKVNLALDGLPTLPLPGSGGAVAHLRVAPSLEYVERAFDDAKYGGFSARPFLDVVIPSAVDPTLAPLGKHVMSALVQFTPYHLKKGSWTDWREELGDLVVDTLEEFMPGLKARILRRQVLTPLDLEERFGLTEGHPYHGEMSLNQLLFMRPVPGWGRYRTPIDGLYLCGSGTHPGGGITGAPGYNAAREVLGDWSRVARA